MTDIRLTNLTMLSIERETVKQLSSANLLKTSQQCNRGIF